MEGKLTVLAFSALAAIGCEKDLETMTHNSFGNHVQRLEVAHIEDRYDINIPVKVTAWEAYPETKHFDGRQSLASDLRNDFGDKIILRKFENGDYKVLILADYNRDERVDDHEGDLPEGIPSDYEGFNAELDRLLKNAKAEIEKEFGQGANVFRKANEEFRRVSKALKLSKNSELPDTQIIRPLIRLKGIPKLGKNLGLPDTQIIRPPIR